MGRGELSAYYSFSDRREQDYQDLSFEMIRRLGYNVDNIANNYPLALNLARAYQGGTAFPAPYTSVDNVYFDASGLRRDHLGYIKASLPINDMFSVNATGYLHKNRGQGS